MLWGHGLRIVRLRSRISTWSSFPAGVNGPASQSIRGIIEDHAHELWFATSAGVSRLRADRSTWDVFNHQSVPQMTSEDILCVTEDGFHRLWFGMAGGGALLLDSTRTQWVAISIVSALAQNNTARSMAVDTQNRIWFLIGGNQPFTVFDPRTPAHWVETDDFLGLHLNCMSAGPDGNVWMGGRDSSTSKQMSQAGSCDSEGRT